MRNLFAFREHAPKRLPLTPILATYGKPRQEVSDFAKGRQKLPAPQIRSWLHDLIRIPCFACWELHGLKCLPLLPAVGGCEIHLAPKKPWNDLIPPQMPTNNGLNHDFKVVQNFVHPQCDSPWTRTQTRDGKWLLHLQNGART